MDYIKIIKESFNESGDLFIRSINLGSIDLTYALLESVSSDDKLSNYLVRSISSDVKYIKDINNLFTYLYNTIPNAKVRIINNIKEAISLMPIGFTLILVPNNEFIIAVETRSSLDRGVSESTTEVVIRGPKDSFCENSIINMGLIRRRLKTNELTFKDYFIGNLTKSRVTVGYINNIVDNKKLKMVLNKINSINVDTIIDSGYIRKLITNNITTFPKVISTERPDLVAMHLAKGKIAIIVENSPIVLILPAFFNEFFNNPEDKFALQLNSLLTKSIRILAFFITLLTPALYITITCFNREIIPIQLLISLASQINNLPFPIYFEILLLVTIFEILREGDIRIPSKMGSSISIVGGLILGDAAVSAGIVSPIAVIIVAITSISGLLFSDIDFVNGLRLWRYLYIIGAAIYGLVGILTVSIILILHLSSIKILNKNYLWGGIHEKNINNS